MTPSTGGNGGRGTRPDLRSSCIGSLTIEVSAGVAALVFVAIALMALFGVAGAQLNLMSVTRDAARAAALQQDSAAASQAAREVIAHEGDAAVVTVDAKDGFVNVRVERRIRPFRIPVTLTARASALEEMPW